MTCQIEERAEFANRDVPSLVTVFWDTHDITCFLYDKRFNKAGGKLKGFLAVRLCFLSESLNVANKVFNSMFSNVSLCIYLIISITARISD